jgi:hypothetical protein
MPIFRKDGKSILFSHVPKAGGSSMEKLFADAGYTTLYRDSKEGPGTVNRLRRCSPQHMHAAMLQQLFRLDRFDFIFMITREPIARFRSEYAMRNRKDLKIDAASVEAWSDRLLAEYAYNPYVLDNHLRPQCEFYLPGCTVYHLEDGLESIVADVNQRLDAGLPPTIPRVLDRAESNGVSSREVSVSPRLERRLAILYREDYALFDYRRPAV